jgi:uncharacterized membrane protein
LTQRGQSTLYTILLMPLLLMVLSLVADVGSLQVELVRLRWANDMALVDAVTEVDAAHYASSGEVRLDAAADSVYRRYLVANLATMRGVMADGATPESVAAAADVAVINSVPATNPFNGHTLDRPAVCSRMSVPLKTSLLGLAGLRSSQTLTISGDAEIRIDLR